MTTKGTYLNAALRLERGEYRGCCAAICETERPGGPCNCEDDGSLQKRFAAIFMPRKPDARKGYWWGDDDRDSRILALCFMAAMVEAGDA